MKVLSIVVTIIALLGLESSYANAAPKAYTKHHLRPKQECIDLARARGFDRSQGQHGTGNSDMNHFIHDCRRGLVK